VLINSMVAVMKPELKDILQDPAAGTGGILIAANHYLRLHTKLDLWIEAQQKKYHHSTFYGMEHVQDTHRLALMNLMLHGIDGGIRYGDTLSPEGQVLPKATLILTNPPFGTKKGGGLPSRDDFTYPTSPQYGKRTQLVREHFAEFEDFFGPDPQGDNSQHRHSREAVLRPTQNLGHATMP